ncbi:MAG: glycosyltransferase family 2 protein [Planctomycetota bacterium]
MNRNSKGPVAEHPGGGAPSGRAAEGPEGAGRGAVAPRTAAAGGLAPASEARHGRVLVVSPCRDEQDYVRRTLDAITQQSHPPALWVIVDDGSTDDTPRILAEYAERFPFIRVIRREDRGKRSVGPGVIEAFYHGLDAVDMDEFEFVCKLDLDLDMPRDYFERLITAMRHEPRLGSFSGKPFYLDEAGDERDEFCDDEITVGMTKFYRVDCFREIGGFVRQVMWDGIDSHRCRMLGWIARSSGDKQLRFEHLRAMGSSDKNVLRGRRRHGAGQHFMGTSLAYICASAVRRVFQAPFLLGSAAMSWGYLSSWFRRVPRYDDLQFRKFLRGYQWSALFRGKQRTIARIEAERADVWRDRRPHDGGPASIPGSSSSGSPSSVSSAADADRSAADAVPSASGSDR